MQKIDLVGSLEFFRGCVSPGVRMNEKLFEFYSIPETRLIRAKCASGVVIAMITDAVQMEYSVAFGEKARDIRTTDIVIGEETVTVEGQGPHKLTFAPGEKEIRIHLPNLIVVENIEISINDGASIKPAAADMKKILICGDSIMQGMTCTSPTRSVGTLLAKHLNMQEHNTSVGGARMCWEPVAETLSFGGDVALVGFGINDAASNTPVEQFREQTCKILELLSNFKGKSFIVIPISCLKIELEKSEPYRQIIREELKKFPKVTGIEGPEFYPAEEDLFIDRIHPNDKGMALYAENLARIIRGVL